MKSKNTIIGIFAHVDAGKTTLSEQILFRTGVIRKAGRVDSKDTCFDFYSQERQRGITIFSKQTNFEIDNRHFTLVDTPGHADFAAETERAMSVPDVSVLVVDGVEGVQSRTVIWNDLLAEKMMPTFVFVNKNDRPEADRERVFESLCENLGNCIDFTDSFEDSMEDIVSLDEKWMESYLEGKSIDYVIPEAIAKRKVIPVVFGSALTGDGVDRLLSVIKEYSPEKEYSDDFSAKVYKVEHSGQDRITFLKITGGKLAVKETIGEEKINQIRIYSGEKFNLTPEINAGSLCGVTGLSESFPGQILGSGENISEKPIFKPSLMTSVSSTQTDTHTLVKALKEVSEDMPELSVRTIRVGNEEQINIGVMGKIQLEVLSEILDTKYGIRVQYGTCRIIYKETVSAPVMGYGHYEPLKHYAESHIRIEPGERGSGVTYGNECSLEVLDNNFQNLVMTHLKEKEHIGTLTGSPLTDVKLVLIAGKSHLKHTEGGDFREATYRAVRQGLEKADIILLEPYYSFALKVPSECIGRAINDIQKMNCDFEAPVTDLNGAKICGIGPVSTLMNYSQEIASYTGGRGSVIFKDAGYYPCHNKDEVVEQIGYEKERDLENTSSSVFCSHGAGFEVKWQDVDTMRHIKD